MKKAYRLKHVPTGLYWVKKSYGRLSETGTVFTTAANSFNGLGSKSTIRLCVTDDRFIQKHLDVFERVGKLDEVPESKWDMKTRTFIPTGKTHLSWHMISKVSDFEKEYVTLDPEQELIEKVVRICYDQPVEWGMISYDVLLNDVKTKLKQ